MICTASVEQEMDSNVRGIVYIKIVRWGTNAVPLPGESGEHDMDRAVVLADSI